MPTMGAEEMTTVATAASAFQAKVIAARLGAEGIVWELRGNVDGMYPLGSTHSSGHRFTKIQDADVRISLPQGT